MKIIVGLGNPGMKYAGTRHNTGFAALTQLADRYSISLSKKECKSITGHGFIEGEKVVLAMPQTYMNLSGEAVQPLLHFYNCTPEDLIILVDDVDLDVGRLRIRGQGSAGGHNGLKSIISCIGTDTFDRVRIGVGKKPEDWDLADHVLGRIPREDFPIFRETCEKAVDAVRLIITDGLQAAQNQFN